MLALHPYARFIIFRLSMIKLMSRVSDEAQHNDILLNTIYIQNNIHMNMLMIRMSMKSI